MKNIVYNLMINFEDIINHQIELLKYAGKNSDTFTVITTLKKPYSKRPPNFIHDTIMMELSSYMVDYIVGIKEWPGTYRSGGSHTVMLTYRLCKSSRYILEKLENWYLPLKNGLPEDYAFTENKNLGLEVFPTKKWLLCGMQPKVILLI